MLNLLCNLSLYANLFYTFLLTFTSKGCVKFLIDIRIMNFLAIIDLKIKIKVCLGISFAELGKINLVWVKVSNYLILFQPI